MAVQANQPVKVQQAKKGGGGLGGMLGLIGGVAATVATGGAAAPALLAGAATGSQLGGMVGNALAPGQAGSVTQQAPAEGGGDNPMLRRLQSGENQAKIAQLREAAMATAELPPPEREQYLNPIMTAAAQLSPRRKA